MFDNGIKYPSCIFASIPKALGEDVARKASVFTALLKNHERRLFSCALLDNTFLHHVSSKFFLGVKIRNT